ncbi:MAG TPA: VOC family protein [Steroidobacteraceae bacterium]|nr:VOC family protein [Steroidobacteraceae bacterium]
MSEQGWHDFLAAEGIDDWVVLHGGATAAFRVSSLSEAARLADAVAKAPGVAGAGVLLTLGYAAVADDNAIDPLGHGSTVWMQELDATKPLRHAMHIDVSVARERVKARLEAAIAAGGRIVDESHAPAHWTLADRAGNRVCICAWPDRSTHRSSEGNEQ